MPRFLTAQWVDAVNQALSRTEVAAAPEDAGTDARSGRFVVAEHVADAPGGATTLLLVAKDGRVRLSLVEDGAAEAADVTIALGYDDAVAMATGELAPADALAAGRVRVRGDLAVLVAGQELLAEARRQAGSLADDTTY